MLNGSSSTLFDRTRCQLCEEIFDVNGDCERHLSHPRDICCQCFSGSIILEEAIDQTLNTPQVEDLLKASCKKRTELKKKMTAILELYNEVRAAYLAEDHRMHKLATLMPKEKLDYMGPDRHKRKRQVTKKMTVDEAMEILRKQGVVLDVRAVGKLLSA